MRLILWSLISWDPIRPLSGLQTSARCTRSAGSGWILQIQGFKNAICSLCSGLSGITQQSNSRVLSHRTRLGDCSVMQCIPLSQSKTDKTDKNLSFRLSTSAPAMQGGTYQSNARANKNDKNPFINILKSSLKFYLLKNSLCNRLWFMLFEPETKLNEVSPNVCSASSRRPRPAWPGLAGTQTEISRQFILTCDQSEPCAVSPAPPLTAGLDDLKITTK